MIGIAFAAAFGFWLAVSVITQWNGRLPDALRRFDHYALVPKWTFFAPNPGSTDYHLVYRDFARGAPSAWREVPVVSRFTLWRGIWNPEKRFSKAITDLVQTLLMMKESETKPEVLPFALPYVAVLNVVAALPASEDVEARQFAIVDVPGYLGGESPRLLLVSGVHPLRGPR